MPYPIQMRRVVGIWHTSGWPAQSSMQACHLARTGWLRCRRSFAWDWGALLCSSNGRKPKALHNADLPTQPRIEFEWANDAERNAIEFRMAWVKNDIQGFRHDGRGHDKPKVCGCTQECIPYGGSGS